MFAVFVAPIFLSETYLHTDNFKQIQNAYEDDLQKTIRGKMVDPERLTSTEYLPLIHWGANVYVE